MKHALTVLTNAAEVAETNAPKRDAAADAYARDGEHKRAENLRAQAELDRAVSAECREAIAVLNAVAAVASILDEVPKDKATDLAHHVIKEIATAIPGTPS